MNKNYIKQHIPLLKKINPLKITLISTLIISGCSTGPKQLSYEEAAAFENSLLAREMPVKAPPQQSYIQPLNKSVACKLPISENLTITSSTKAYWDGDCKDGFAYGLGRHINISDTHHIEEITIHNGTGDNWSQPKVSYTLNKGTVLYKADGSTFPEENIITTQLKITEDGLLDITHNFKATDTLGFIKQLQFSPFDHKKIILNSRANGTIGYSFIDETSSPIVNWGQPEFSAMIVDPTNSKATAAQRVIGFYKYPNEKWGFVQTLKGRHSLVIPPQKYTNHILSKYREVIQSLENFTEKFTTVYDIKKVYLETACHSSNTDKIDENTYRKLCDWEKQISSAYTLTKSKREQWLASLPSRDEQIRHYKYLDMQAEYLKAMHDQAKYQESINKINQTARQIQQQANRANQTTNSIMSNSFTPITSNRKIVTYHNIGDSVYGSDGSSLHRVGNTIITNNKDFYQKIGNTILGSDGSAYHRVGDIIIGNDNTRCYKVGQNTICK